MKKKAARPRNPLNPRGERCQAPVGGLYDTHFYQCARTALLRSPRNGAWLCPVHSARRDREVPLLEGMLAATARAQRETQGAGA